MSLETHSPPKRLDDQKTFPPHPPPSLRHPHNPHNMSSLPRRTRPRPVDSSSSDSDNDEAPEEVSVTTAREQEEVMAKAQQVDTAKRAAKRKERKKAAATRMRERQEKARAKKLSAEHIMAAEALLRQQEEEEADESSDPEDEDDPAGTARLTAKDYRQGQDKEGFTVRVLHNDDDEEDDHALTHRTTSTVAHDFMQRTLSGAKRRGHGALTSFNSGVLTEKKSYRRKRPSKKQKREWQAAKIRQTNEEMDEDEDGGLVFE